MRNSRLIDFKNDCRITLFEPYSTSSFDGRIKNEKGCGKVMRVRPVIKDTWMYHNNAPCHTVFSITELLTRENIPVVPQPPYSPEMSPCDFLLFPQLKKPPKRTSFWNNRKHKTKRGRPAEGHSSFGLPALLRGVEFPNEAVYCFSRKLLEGDRVHTQKYVLNNTCYRISLITL
ncbi:hypothetical protein J6590_108313 [Homalodisca vitripennis]|nr:hypothetical protein J6590_108313 [Homalodisca vitripennis]